MFNNFLTNLKKKKAGEQKKYEKLFKEQAATKINWTKFMDKQLKHLVMVHEFNFEKVFDLMIKVYPKEKLTQKGCEARWAIIYKKTKPMKEKPTGKENRSKSQTKD